MAAVDDDNNNDGYVDGGGDGDGDWLGDGDEIFVLLLYI